MTYRYAIYYCPEPNSALGAFGAEWLGRAIDGRETGVPVLGDISEPAWRAATAEPRRYGFHATLKPPFRLAPGVTETDLCDAIEAFSRTTSSVPLGRLQVQQLSGFLALRPERDEPVTAFARTCVKAFDGFRAPPTAEEIAKRRPDSLTGRQRHLLERWGYPHVMEEFRFHMTLTGRLSDPEADLFRKTLEKRYAALVDQPAAINDVCLLQQDSPEESFVLAGRFALSGDEAIARRPRSPAEPRRLRRDQKTGPNCL